MELLWILSVFCLYCMIHVHCEINEDDSVSTDDLLQTSFSLGTESSASTEQAITDQPDGRKQSVDFSEMPVVHNILLRPSVVSTFEKLGEMIPVTSETKFDILDHLIDLMYKFALSERPSNCSSEMRWLNLVIASSQFLRVNHERECTYNTFRSQNPSRFGIMPPESPCRSETTESPCPSSTTEKPCLGSSPENEYSEDLISAPLVGSVRGIPGVHYPDYSDVPITNFSCADKKVPGFYADLDTGCQVFHVCYEHRRESFLCPVGTIFNQPILACDYWYSSNCSLAPLYYDTIQKDGLKEESLDIAVEDLVSILMEEETESVSDTKETKDVTLEDLTPFLPVKAVVTEFKPEETKVDPVKPESEDVDLLASEIFDRIIASTTKLTTETRGVVSSIPEPEEKYKPETLEKLFAKSKIPLAKAKMASIPVGKFVGMKAAVPVVAKAKLAAAAVPVMAAKAKVAAVPVVTKAKFAAAAVPVMATKAKVAAALPAKIAKSKISATLPIAAKAKLAAAVPVVATKAKVTAALPAKIAKTKLAAVSPLAVKAKALPKVAVKAKMASAVPIAKAKMLAPLMKGKIIKGASAPLLKGKALGVPLVKSKLAGSIPLAKLKLAKGAAISPLTKKALALGYMKLLKAKKLPLMG